MEKLTTQIKSDCLWPATDRRVADACFFEPTNRNIKISVDEYDNYYNTYFLPFPYITFVKTEIDEGNDALTVLFSNDNPNRPEVRLYVPPLPNIYCLGTTCIEAGCKFALKDAIQIFWSSSFSSYFSWVDNYQSLCQTFGIEQLYGRCLRNIVNIKYSTDSLKKWSQVKNPLNIQWKCKAIFKTV